MKRIKAALACAASFICLAAVATPTTWRVTQQGGDDAAAALDDTGATAFETIQAAVAKAAAGDTILVSPGTYTGPATTNASYGVSRLHIDKALTIESTGTRADTIIEGRWDTAHGNAYGLGVDAIRGFCATADVTIKGFTFLNGATLAEADSTDEKPRSGGGFYGTANSKIIDCAFVDCSGTRGGGMRYGKAFRTLFRNCYASKYGPAGRQLSLEFCVVERCKGPRTIAWAYNKVSHCTFIGNESNDKCIHVDSNVTVRNCVFASGATDGYDSKVTFDGCVSWAASINGTVNPNTRLGVNDGIISPIFGDAHPVADGVLDGTGETSCRNYITEGYDDLDYEGNPVDWSAGKLCPGAIQKPVAAASGKMQFANNTATLTVDGVTIGPDKSTNYTYSTCWPTQYLVAAKTSTSSQEILRLDMYNSSGSSMTARRPPLTLDNTAWVTAPPASETRITYIPTQTDRIHWVSNGADSASANGTEAHPYATLQDAFSKTSGNRIIKVTPGIYDQGIGADAIYGSSNRVEYTNGGFVRLMGLAGAEKTIIVGAADQGAAASDYGCGPAAVRCFAVSSGNCVVQGFTLTGGHSGIGESIDDDSASTRGGATILATDVTSTDSSATFFVDCIISNNVAWHFSVGSGSRFIRCLIAENRTICNDAALMGAISSACVFRDNISPTGDVRGNSGYTYNCTIVKSDASQGPAWARGNVGNCVCYALTEPVSTATTIAGTLVDGFTASNHDVLRADPVFRDRAGGDYRLGTCSPAIALGSPDLNLWWQFAGADFNGNRYRFIDGKVISGAFQTLVPSLRLGVSAGPVSGISVDGVATTGVVFFAENDTLAITANDASTRLFDGFALNGEKVAGSEANASYTYSPDGVPVPGDSLTALYLTNWYANAASGSDANSGASAVLAKKTLAAAVAHAVPGDVVHAAEGTYSDGSMLHTGYVYVKTPESSEPAPYIASRVVVPAGVSLVADGARTNTVILGASDTTPSRDDYGCGPKAMRCVFLETNAVIRGFTLRGGCTDYVNLEDDNNEAGGLLGRQVTTVAEDCQFEDCRSVRGGAGRMATFRRCRFIGNSASGIGVVGREAYFHGCYFQGNVGRDVISFPYKVTGCTFAASNVTTAGGSTLAPPIGSMGTSSDARRIVNTLFCGKTAISSDEFINCAMPSNATFYASGDKTCVFTDCVKADAKDLSRLDADGVPVAGVNPACDGGDLAAWIASGLDAAKDAAGNPRVANAAMDIGCYEADWKMRYSADIGRRGAFIVSDADPDAHEEANREVRLTGGEIAGTLNVAGRCMFPLRITGTGTLTVTVGGVASVYTGPLAPFQLSIAATEGTAMSFAYEPADGDEGGAFIGLGGRQYGSTFIIR